MPLESSDFEHRSMMQDTPPSLIETMKADAAGMIALLPYHLRRLKHSAQALGYTYPGDDVVIAELKVIFDQASAASSNFSGTRVRLLLSPIGGLDIQTAPLSTLQVLPWIALTRLRLDSDEPLLQHKTTHRPWYDAATQWLGQHPDYFDLIFLNEKGELCEGSRSNIYVLQNGTWLTPPLASGLLGGVLRTQLLETGQAEEAILTPSNLTADKASIRLSNALRGWFDVQMSPLVLPGHFLP
jgi:4-amino-4-deoxychorismate lyase